MKDFDLSCKSHLSIFGFNIIYSREIFLKGFNKCVCRNLSIWIYTSTFYRCCLLDTYATSTKLKYVSSKQKYIHVTAHTSHLSFFCTTSQLTGSPPDTTDLKDPMFLPHPPISSENEGNARVKNYQDKQGNS